MQPTGEMHLGNYFGAVQNWVELQKKYDCIYGIVDYHAMTKPFNAHELREKTRNMIIELIAIGIEPSSLFVQSLVPEHTELAWILSCVTSFNDLIKQPQFKDEKDKGGYISGGYFSYPVLQAADILIYKAGLVPVGKDQSQHIELTRGIANRFNKQFDCDFFQLPESVFSESPKILSLADPSKKMSKSLGEKHYISLMDDEKNTWKKIKAAVTDSGAESSGELGPSVLNMLGIIKACGNAALYSTLHSEAVNGELKYSELKNALHESIVDHTREFKVRKKSLLGNIELVEKKILDSSNSIRNQAKRTLDEVKKLTGIGSYNVFTSQSFK